MAIVGYAPGAYDMFHVGHLNLLRRAAENCDHLIAGVVSDEVVAKVKGRAPVMPFAERLEIVRSLRCVDEAVADVHADKFDSWRDVGYHVLFKGDDWQGTERAKALERKLAKAGARIMYFPYTIWTSSTILRNFLNTAGASTSHP